MDHFWLVAQGAVPGKVGTREQSFDLKNPLDSDMSKIRVGVMGQGRSGYNIHVNCITGVESVAGALLRALLLRVFMRSRT